MLASEICSLRPSVGATIPAKAALSPADATRRIAHCRVGLLTGLLAALAMPVALAQSCYDTGDTATANYSDSGGTVYVEVNSNPVMTGLMWRRCVEGRDGAACTGTAAEMNWQASLDAAAASRYAEFNDWRMPSRAELESLVAWPCTAPTINQTVFPNTPFLLNSWTGETVPGNPNFAYIVNWISGSTGQGQKSLDFHVRLVRGGGGQVPYTAQTIQFGSAPTGVVVGVGVTVTASNVGAHSTNPIRFRSLVPGACSVVESTGAVTPIAVGTCIIEANQYGRDAYWPAQPKQQSFPVGKGPQTLTFNPAPVINLKGSGTVVAVSATPNSGNPVTYGSSTPSVCTVNTASGLVTPLLTGNCAIAANQVGNSNFHPATAATQTIVIGPAPCRLDVDGDGTHNAQIDGLLLLRYLLGISGPPLVGGLNAFPALAQRTTDSAITSYLNTLDLDVDGSGEPALATTDGVIVLRAMLGFRGAAVTAGLPIAGGALRPDWASIGPHLSGVCAMPVSP